MTTPNDPTSVPSPTPNWTHSPQPGNYVNSVAVSGDGGTVIGGTFKHTYSAEAVARPRRTPGPDGQAAASTATADYGVYCYNGSGGSLRWSDVFNAYEGVYWVAVSADGSRAAAGGTWSESPYEGFLRAYDATNGTILLDYRTPARVNMVAMSADGQWLIAGAESVMLFQYDSSTGKYKKTGGFTPSVASGKSEVVSVGISADGSSMLYAEYTGTMGYALNEGGLMAVLKTFSIPNGGYCHSTALSPSGNFFASGGNDGKFYMFDVAQFLQSGQPTYTCQTSASGAIYGVAVAEDGSSYAGVINTSDSGEVYLVPVSGGVQGPPQTFDTLRNPNCVTLDSAHGLMAVADGHPDGSPGHFYLYSNIGGTASETWCYPTDNMSWPVSIAANGQSVVGGSDDSSIYSFPV